MKFRFPDLIVVFFVLIFLFTLLIPVELHHGESAVRIKCAANLKSIGQALLIYANDNHNQYPRTKWDANSSQLNFFTNPDAKNPFADDGPLPNDVTASIYLLVRTVDIGLESFRCSNVSVDLEYPSDAAQKSNFTSPQFLSYSFANPFPSPQALANGYHWDSKLSQEFAVAADKNPGNSALGVSTLSTPKQMQTANSPNHAGDGQNILYGDGHAAYLQNPFGGINSDNIYTFGVGDKTHPGGEGVIGLPTSAEDSTLLPIADGEIQLVPTPEQIRQKREMIFWIIRIAAFVLVVVSILGIKRRRLAATQR